MRDPRDRYSLVMGRLLIVVAICGAAGLVVPLSCHGQALGDPLNRNAKDGSAPHHVSGARPARERDYKVGVSVADHRVVADRASAPPVALPLGLVSLDGHAVRFRPLAGQSISAERPALNHHRHGPRRVEGVEHRGDTLRIRVIPPATDDYPHALNIAPNAPKVQRDGTYTRPADVHRNAGNLYASPRVLALPVTGVWLASVYAIRAEGEWHHAYLGVALLAVPSHKLQWLGLAVLTDDALQHLIQTRRPAYRSPLHRLYAVTLYRWTR
jgi:hypothetical protein